MERRNRILEIVGAIAGFILVIAIVNIAVDQFNTDRQSLAEEFQVQLLMREDQAGVENGVEAEAEAADPDVPVDAAADDAEIITEEEEPDGGMTTQGNEAVDIELTSPELPGGPEEEVVPITEPVTEPITENGEEELLEDVEGEDDTQ